jgi:hypothetical protein
LAEEGKSQTYVKTHKAVAAGVASVIAAVFTYRLGVAGTLIGMELTAVVITLSSENGTGPSSVQQIHIPGKANAEPNPEPSTPDKALACSPACAPCQASSESYRPSRGLGYASLVCSPGW